jgi:acetyl esterase/lipase
MLARGMKTLVAAVILLGTLSTMKAQTNSFPLWPDGAPGALGSSTNDVPTLTPFFPKPDRATGAAMVVCPGGGYERLAGHEGKVYAQWLNDHGITAFVLKYRLGSAGYHHPTMLQDGARAIRLVRARAGEWKLDRKRIGIIGSSAGGHLTSTVITHFDAGDPKSADPIERQSSRPDLAVLCYPVITMGEFAHAGSKKNLLGTNAPPSRVRELSSELQVTKDTPPCFVWHTFEDKTVPLENSLMFASALRAAGVPCELHVYEKGAHGIGLGVRQYESGDDDKLLPWTHECVRWLKERGFAD